ncbi:hypothetical protein D3C78_803820 [compost metagenome]
MRRGGTLGLRALLQRHAQGRQIGQRVCLRVEFRRWRNGSCLGLQLCRLDHRRHGFGLGLDQLGTWLSIGHLTGHQVGIEQCRVRRCARSERVILPLRQGLAATGKLRLLGGIVLAIDSVFAGGGVFVTL